MFTEDKHVLNFFGGKYWVWEEPEITLVLLRANIVSKRVLYVGCTWKFTVILFCINPKLLFIFYKILIILERRGHLWSYPDLSALCSHGPFWRQESFWNRPDCVQFIKVSTHLYTSHFTVIYKFNINFFFYPLLVIFYCTKNFMTVSKLCSRASFHKAVRFIGMYMYGELSILP